MTTGRATKVVAWTTMPRNATKWRREALPEESAKRIRQRRGCRDRGRLHPASGSDLPSEGIAPPFAVAARFCSNPMRRAFAGDLLCQAPSEGNQPFASSPFAHLIPQNPRRACEGFVQRFLLMYLAGMISARMKGFFIVPNCCG